MMKSNLFTRKSTNSWCLSLWFLRQRNCSSTLILWVFWSHAGQVKVQDLFDLEGYWCVLQEDKYNISSPYRHVTCDVYRWAGIYRDSYKSPPSDWGRQFSLSLKKPFYLFDSAKSSFNSLEQSAFQDHVFGNKFNEEIWTFPVQFVSWTLRDRRAPARGNQRKGGYLWTENHAKDSLNDIFLSGK